MSSVISAKQNNSLSVLGVDLRVNNPFDCDISLFYHTIMILPSCHNCYCCEELTCDSEGHDLLIDQEDLQFSFF